MKEFENTTYDLTKEEREIIIPILVRGLSLKLGKGKAITNKHIIFKLKDFEIKTSAPRIRKMIHYIRIKHLVSRLCACQKGYYIATNTTDMINYRESLTSRLTAIQSLINTLDKDILQFNDS